MFAALVVACLGVWETVRSATQWISGYTACFKVHRASWRSGGRPFCGDVRCDLVDGASDDERVFRCGGKEKSNDAVVVSRYEEWEVIFSEGRRGLRE